MQARRICPQQISYVLRGIKKLVKISDCRVLSFLKTVPGCRVSRHVVNNKICYIVKNKLIIKSYKWNVLCSLISYDSTKLHHKKVCLITVSAISLLYCLHTSALSSIFESLHFCLERSCKLHVFNLVPRVRVALST